MFCFLGFKIFESDKERSFSIKLQRIMVSGVWSLWRDYKFWGKSLQEIFIKRFHFILITFHKSSRSNSFIFEYSRWCWDDQTLWGEISEINLPPPELQQFYSSQPQHLESSNTDSPVLRYWGDTIALSIIFWLWHYIVYLLSSHFSIVIDQFRQCWEKGPQSPHWVRNADFLWNIVRIWSAFKQKSPDF